MAFRREKIIDLCACYRPKITAYCGQKIEKERNATMNKKIQKLIRKSGEFKTFREEAREAIAAYAEGADFLFTVSCLAVVGRKMELMLG